MARFLFLFFTIIISLNLYAQNIGIGTSTPVNKLEVLGNLVLTEPYTAIPTAPVASQVTTGRSAVSIGYYNTATEDYTLNCRSS